MHRITRKFGHKGDRFGMRRKTIKCIYCQNKTIEGRSGRKFTHVFVEGVKQK